MIETVYHIPQQQKLRHSGASVLFVGAEKERSEFGFVLDNLLGALKLQKDKDASTLFIEDEAVVDIGNITNADIFVIFGLKPEAIGLNINAVQNKAFALNGSRFLFTKSLQTLEEQNDQKRIFWKALKQIIK